MAPSDSQFWESWYLCVFFCWAVAGVALITQNQFNHPGQKYYLLAFKMTVSTDAAFSNVIGGNTRSAANHHFSLSWLTRTLWSSEKCFQLWWHSCSISYKLFQKVWHCSSLLWKSLRNTIIWLPSKGFIELFSSVTHYCSKYSNLQDTLCSRLQIDYAVNDAGSSAVVCLFWD